MLASNFTKAWFGLSASGVNRGSVLRKVVAIEFGVFIHCTREETFPEWTIRHEADSQLFEGRNDFYFRRAGPQRIFALESSGWLNFVRPTDSLHSRFRGPK